MCSLCLVNLLQVIGYARMRTRARRYCAHVNMQVKYKKLVYVGNTYGSSGVRCTGSLVNSGGKFAKSLSESNRGLYGGDTCFCSSCKNKQQRY